VPQDPYNTGQDQRNEDTSRVHAAWSWGLAVRSLGPSCTGIWRQYKIRLQYCSVRKFDVLISRAVWGCVLSLGILLAVLQGQASNVALKGNVWWCYGRRWGPIWGSAIGLKAPHSTEDTGPQPWWIPTVICHHHLAGDPPCLSYMTGDTCS
jgi:hypothetical protein